VTTRLHRPRGCIRLLAGICLALGIDQSSLAYDMPALNLGETSFFDGASPVTGPGLYGAQYLATYDASKFTDAAGHKVALPSQELRLFAPVTQLIYLAQPTVFGIAHPGAMVILPAVAGSSVKDGLSGAVLKSTTGLGDAVFGAFLMFDPIMGPSGPRFAQSVEFDVITPTGHYNRNAAINPGSNFVSINPFYAATFWATPEWSVSGRFHYLWNATNDAPNASLGPTARTSQTGQAFHMNLASQYQLTETWGIGLNGYYLHQVTDTRINGQSVPGRRERVFAIGPGLTVTLNKDYSIFLNAYKEFAAENRAEGDRVVLRFNAHL